MRLTMCACVWAGEQVNMAHCLFVCMHVCVGHPIYDYKTLAISTNNTIHNYKTLPTPPPR